MINKITVVFLVLTALSTAIAAKQRGLSGLPNKKTESMKMRKESLRMPMARTTQKPLVCGVFDEADLSDFTSEFYAAFGGPTGIFSGDDVSTVQSIMRDTYNEAGGCAEGIILDTVVITEQEYFPPDETRRRLATSFSLVNRYSVKGKCRFCSVGTKLFNDAIRRRLQVAAENFNSAAFSAFRGAGFDKITSVGVSNGIPVDETLAPSLFPTSEPTENPTAQPTANPTYQPTNRPTSQPSAKPTSQPTNRPTAEPTSKPTSTPTPRPTSEPTSAPSYQPTLKPTSRPTSQPTSQPTALPTPSPSDFPSSEPTKSPSNSPTPQPTSRPTSQPTAKPTSQPTNRPTTEPTSKPTSTPTPRPTSEPTSAPTSQPTLEPTSRPTSQPTSQPTALPTPSPSDFPSSQPTNSPSNSPTPQPTDQPTSSPTLQPIAPTSPPLPCGDSRNMTFPVLIESKTVQQRCIWLAARADDQAVYCDPSIPQGAYYLCPETCKACVDDCVDDPKWTFEYRNSTRNCSWLRLRVNVQDIVCIPGEPVYLFCKESCNNCPGPGYDLSVPPSGV